MGKAFDDWLEKRRGGMKVEVVLANGETYRYSQVLTITIGLGDGTDYDIRPEEINSIRVYSVNKQMKDSVGELTGLYDAVRAGHDPDTKQLHITKEEFYERITQYTERKIQNARLNDGLGAAAKIANLEQKIVMLEAQFNKENK
jgi:hypothetical protein